KDLGAESELATSATRIMGDVIEFIEDEKYDLIEYHVLQIILAELKALDASAFADTITALERVILVMA
ncbi:MAG: hypothetical protein IJC95_01640, partial [Clostridia bacterium]|nr:hypothetical protein [Clostridia bacterium]